MQLSTMITKRSVTVNFDGQTHTLSATDPLYQKMVNAIKSEDYDSIRALASRAKMLVAAANSTSNGNFEVNAGVVFIDGKEVPNELSAQIIDFMNEGLPFQPLVNFYRKLAKNPSTRALTALYSFLEKNRHPITESGNFIAYKRVNAADTSGRMLDIHSKTFDNQPGSVLEMPRSEVDDDPNVTCSRGLHVSNWDYAAKHFHAGMGVLIEVEVDPENVVAIPHDYNESKMRVCGYKVRAIVANPTTNNTLVVDSTEEVIEEGDSCHEGSDSHNSNCFSDFDEVEELDDEIDEVDDEEESEEDLDDEEEESSVQSPTSVSFPKLTVPFHSSETLRKMSSERLNAYKKRLIDMSTLDSSILRSRADTLVLVRKILNSRR